MILYNFKGDNIIGQVVTGLYPSNYLVLSQMSNYTNDFTSKPTLKIVFECLSLKVPLVSLKSANDISLPNCFFIMFAQW